MPPVRLVPDPPPAADPWNVYGGGTPSTADSIRPLPSAPAAADRERRDPSGMMRIGEILVGAGAITPEARDRVLEYQEWNHVSFGTALLESGELPEQLFLRALSVQFSVPAASAAELDEVPPEVLGLVRRRVADRLSVLPLRRVGRTLHLAMARPKDRSAIRSVQLLAGLTVVPHVAIAFRLALALEKHYGIPAAAHYRAVAQALAARPPAAPRPARALPGAAPAPAGAEAPRPAPRLVPRPQPPAPVPWSRLTDALAAVASPDELAATLLGFLGETAGPSAVYVVRRDEASLLRTWPAANHTSGLRIALSEGSLLAGLRDANDVFTGHCPDGEANRRLLASLGERLSCDVFVVPVNVNGRTVLFLVGRSDRGAPPLDRPSLRRLGRIAATALGLVALRSRLRTS